jgi:hypothetical protein
MRFLSRIYMDKQDTQDKTLSHILAILDIHVEFPCSQMAPRAMGDYP